MFSGLSTLSKMMLKMGNESVAVIVGRFQVPRPTPAHIGLLEYAINNYGSVIVFIGYSPIRNRLNIIPKEIVKEIIENICEQIKIKTGKYHAKIIVSTIVDVFNPPLWSNILDQQIISICRTNNLNTGSIYGVGGRDCYMFKYSGSLLKPDIYRSDLGDEISATEIRNRIVKDGCNSNEDFLKGMIFQRLSQYETSYQTVDVAIRFNGAFLMGHRRGNSLYRFIGGFSDPNSNSLEEDAIRETFEETNLKVSNPKYLTSIKVDDARYKNSGDCIKTAFFIADATEYGVATFDEPIEENGFDDMPFIRWFMPKDLNESMIVKEHTPLYKFLKNNNII